MIQKGCEAYLAHVIDTRKKEAKLEGIPVVNEFQDVFPIELDCHQIEMLSLPLSCYPGQLLFLLHPTEWLRQS